MMQPPKPLDVIIFTAIMLALIALAAACTGCAKPEPVYITEYKEVKVPVMCDAVSPPRPAPDKDVLTMVNAVLRYTETLEALLEYCKGDNRHEW